MTVSRRRAEPADDGHPGARMCPSTAAENATVLLGMITMSGRVAYLTPAVPAAPLIESDDDGIQPLETRYRFAGPCVESGCGFWTGEQCGLGARLADSYAKVNAANQDPPHLPRCAIRSRCRWYAEQGSRACAACPLVVTDSRV